MPLTTICGKKLILQFNLAHEDLENQNAVKDPFLKYSLHLGAWFLLLFLPYLLSFKKAVQFDQLWHSTHELKNFLSWLLLIGFSYANHLWMVPRYYLERRRVQYFLLVLMGLAIILLLPESLNWFSPQPPAEMVSPGAGNFDMGPGFSEIPPGLEPGMTYRPKPALVLENSHLVLLFIVSVLGSISYQTQIRLRDTEQQRLQTELEHLKAQIQPHFLFNTLNSIYALAIRKDDKTADTVVQLSEFLRYVIRDTRHNLVDLGKEIAYIRNYIDLQRSRLRDSVAVSFELEGIVQGQQIGPLILFSFIENAFKHGVNPEEDSVIDIRVNVEEKHVRLWVYNKKVLVMGQEADAGIGVKNARKRLKLLYPDRHILTITDRPEDYTVDLTISI